MGNHAVAGIVTEEFLDYSASQGNDLRVVGLSEGYVFKSLDLSSGGMLELRRMKTDETDAGKV